MIRIIFLFIFILVGCENIGEHHHHNEFPNKPNIIVIMTDQERYPQHFPKGWEEHHLPAMQRLKRHGMSFLRAYTAACECAPSRAVLSTGEYYPVNQIPHTPAEKPLPSRSQLQDIGALLTEFAGYDVVWKGKWHLMPPLKGGHQWTEDDIAVLKDRYDLLEWNPPDAGNAITEQIKEPDGSFFNGLKTLGGGFANNDGRFLHGNNDQEPKQTKGFGEGALEYLQKIAQKKPAERKPFCLFISLVNPHDVWVYPKHYKEAGYDRGEFAGIGIDLPSNYADDLSKKPSVQAKARDAFNLKSPLTGREQELEYVNFYAYLHQVVDDRVGEILDALEQYNLLDDTLIIRTADHGELGLSHGMREKSYCAYDEVIHIPLVFSNPKIFHNAQTTESLYSHVDLVPTLADLCGIPASKVKGPGVSVVPVIRNPLTSVQDAVLFAYDDLFFLPANTPGSHIRAIREKEWLYAVYYSDDGSSFEYELYQTEQDPGQMHNLISKSASPEHLETAYRLHRKLKEKIDEAKALPKNFPWPLPVN